jgi:peptide/nickel transport system permease protein
MRFTDIMLVIPDLPLAVVIVALTKPSLWNIIFVIGALGWTVRRGWCARRRWR